MSQSVTRAAHIIDAIAADPRTVAELAEAFGLHRSTMFRELQALEQVGWVRRRASGRYALGTRLAALSREAMDSLDLREAGAEHVRRLQRRTGNTVHLAASWTARSSTWTRRRTSRAYACTRASARP